MLNFKGRYYAAEVIDNIDSIKNTLLNFNILKIGDLGEPKSHILNSKIIPTDFWAKKEANINVRGFSEEIIKDLRAMGELNLAHKDLSETVGFYTELRSVYDGNATSLKGYEYFKIFYRYNFAVTRELKNAISMARKNLDVPAKPKGVSLSFLTDEDNVLIMPNVKEDFYRLDNVLAKSIDFSTVAIKMPSNDSLNQDMKYVQINADNVLFHKNNIIVNVTYENFEDLEIKIFPIVSTYKNKQLEIVGLSSKGELINLLKDYHKATTVNRIVDTEIFYEAIEKFTLQQANQRPVCLLTGKNQLSYISVCESKKTWPAIVLNAKTVEEITNSTTLMSPRILRSYHTKNKERMKRSAAE